MKKILLSSIILGLSSMIYAGEIDLLGVQREFGMTGLETSVNYNNINRGEKNVNIDHLKDIYNVIDNTNTYLSRSFLKDDLQKEYILRLNYNYLKAENLKVPSLNLTFAGLYTDDSRLGINLTYNDLKTKINKNKAEGEGYQLSLFYLNSDPFDNSSSLVNIYYGTTDEEVDNLDDKYKTNYYGLYAELEKLYEGFNDFSKGYNLKFEGKRVDEELGKDDNTNESVTLELDGVFQKIFYISNFNTVNLRGSLGYERKFLDKVYHNEKYSDKDNIIAKVEITGKINEVLNLYSDFEYRKSLNTSYDENRIALGVKFNF